MEKLTIHFEVKGYDRFLTTFENGKLDVAEIQGKVDAGDFPFDYWETPLKDYEFYHDDMGNTQIEVTLDTGSAEEDFKNSFIPLLVDENGPWGLTNEEAAEQAQFPIKYANVFWDEDGEKFYNHSECFTEESMSFNNSARWEMIVAIKDSEQDKVLISEYFKGPYTHSYSWNIDSDRFDFTKLCFHYGSGLSRWDCELSLPSNDWGSKALVAVTYDGKLPDEWHIEPPIENKGWNMIIIDGSEIAKEL